MLLCCYELDSNEESGRWTDDVKADLSSDRVGQPVVGKLLLERSNKLGSETVDLVVRLEVKSLLDAAVMNASTRSGEAGVRLMVSERVLGLKAVEMRRGWN